MNKLILCCALMTGSGSLLIAADAKEEVTAATKKLGEQANYSWTTTVVVPESARWRPGPTEGKTEKNGDMYVKMTFGENTTAVVKQGAKAAFTNRDGEWQSLADAEGQEGPGRFMVGFVRNLQTPADQATNIVSGVQELKKDGEIIAGDLTEEGAKNLMRFRRGGEGPAISDAKGSVKFWLKDGMLAKYEFKVSGKMDFNGNEVELDRTTTVEIKEVGKTKIEVPEGAKSKLT